MDLSNRKIANVQREMEGEKALELIRAGDDPARKSEIEQRYAQSALVLTTERINAEKQLRENLNAQLTDRDRIADNTAKLAGLEVDLEGARAQTNNVTDQLKAKEQERVDLALQQMRTAADDSQVLAALARQLQAEGRTADEIQRQLSLKADLLRLERQFPGNAQIQAAAIDTAKSKAAADQVVQDTRDQAQEVANTWQNATRRVDNAFAQMWQNVLSGQQTAGATIKQMFNGLLAELAHAALTRPIEITILRAMGAPAGATDWKGGGGVFDSVTASSMPVASTIGDGLGSAWNTVSGWFGPSAPAPGAASGGAAGDSAASAASQAAAEGINYDDPTMGGAGRAGETFKGAGLPGEAVPSSGATLGQALGGFGAGMAVGQLAQSFGLKGQNSTANSVAPAVGSAIGMGVGMALMPVLGPLGPLLGGMLGGLMGSGSSMLFKSATPSATAWYTYQSGAVREDYSRNHAKGDLAGLEKIGGALADPLNAMQAQFGVDLGTFSYGLAKSGAKGKEEFTIAGSDASGEFARFKGKAEDAQDMIDRFEAALLKRKKTLAQFDDDLMKGAIQTGDTLTAISKSFAKVQSLRTFEGERSSQAATTEKLGADYRDYRNTIEQVSGGITRAVELVKLDEAYKKQFERQVTAYQSAVSAFGGGPTSAMADSIAKVDAAADDLRAQNKELEQAAKKSHGKVNYTPITEADIEQARAQALAKLQGDFLGNLRQLAGVAAPLSTQIADLSRQFRQLSTDAKAAGVDTAAIGATVAAQFAGLAQATVAPILTEREANRASQAKILGVDTTAADLASARATLAANTNAAAELGLIQQVRAAVESRYQSELSRLQNLQAAYQRIADYAKGAALSNNSFATPQQRVEAARRNYEDLLAKAKTGDITALGSVAGAADTYKTELRGYGASSQANQTIFGQIDSAMAALGAKAADTTTAIDGLKADAVDQLKQLDRRLGDQLVNAQAQLQAGLDQVAALGALNGTQTQALGQLVAMVAAGGTTNTLLSGLVANLQGQAGTAIAGGAATAGAAPAAHAADSTGFLLAFEKDKAGLFGRGEAARLEKFIDRLDTTGYNAADWALLRSAGQTVEAYSQSLAADGKPGQAGNVHAVAAGINGKLPADMRFFAAGGYAAPGWAIVGEHGPELVNFTDPGRVYTAAQTREMLRAANDPQRPGQPAAPGARHFAAANSWRATWPWPARKGRNWSGSARRAGSTPPPGPVTCWIYTGADLARYLILRADSTGTLVDGDSLDAFAATCPQTLGLYVDTDANIDTLLDRICETLGAQWTPGRDGRIKFWRLDAPAGTATLDFNEYDVDLDAGGIVVKEVQKPAYKLRLGYDRNWAPLDVATINPAVTDADTRSRLSTEYRYVSALDESIRVAHPLADDLGTVDTLFVSKPVAEAERDRRMALHGAIRTTYKVVFGAAPLRVERGQEIALDYPRYQFAGGATGIVRALDERLERGVIEVELWR